MELEGIITLIIIGIIVLAIALGVAIPLIVLHVRNKNRVFVYRNSRAIKELIELNRKIKFKNVDETRLSFATDNVDYYDKVSCDDYLIYCLVEIKDRVLQNIMNAYENKKTYDQYLLQRAQIKNHFGQFGVELKPNKLKIFLKIEKEHFLDITLADHSKYSIRIVVKLTKINGVLLTYRWCDFYPADITRYLTRLENKTGKRYNDDEIWKAICRVERAKVTNKLRFAILDRDGHRCRICGKSDLLENLEIDHIIPIARGGKSTPDNLQVLCHACNKKKGHS